MPADPRPVREFGHFLVATAVAVREQLFRRPVAPPPAQPHDLLRPPAVFAVEPTGEGATLERQPRREHRIEAGRLRPLLQIQRRRRAHQHNFVPACPMLADAFEHFRAHEARQIGIDERARLRIERILAHRPERERRELRFRIATRQQPGLHRNDPRQRTQSGPGEAWRADRIADEMAKAVGRRDGAVEIECGNDAVSHGESAGKR